MVGDICNTIYTEIYLKFQENMFLFGPLVVGLMALSGNNLTFLFIFFNSSFFDLIFTAVVDLVLTYLFIYSWLDHDCIKVKYDRKWGLRILWSYMLDLSPDLHSTLLGLIVFGSWWYLISEVDFFMRRRISFGWSC